MKNTYKKHKKMVKNKNTQKTFKKKRKKGRLDFFFHSTLFLEINEVLISACIVLIFLTYIVLFNLTVYWHTVCEFHQHRRQCNKQTFKTENFETMRKF